MGNDLNRTAEEVALALLLDYGIVDLAGSEVVGLAELCVGKSLVVTKVQSVSAPSSVTKTSPC